MKRVVETKLADDGPLMVEAGEADGVVPGPRTRGRGSVTPDAVTQKAQSTFEDAMKVVAPTAEKLIAQLHQLDRAPDQVMLQFGLSMTAHAGVVLSASVTGNFTV